MLRALGQEPKLATDLPRWIADAKIRKAPMDHRKPWWNYHAVAFVEARLPHGARVFEYGGGASTLWLGDQGATVTTVEDSADWLAALAQRLPADADVRFVETPANASAAQPWDPYSRAIEVEPDDSFDLVIVDGRARRDCVLAAAPKVRPGGMLLLDDSQASDTEPPPRGDPTRMRTNYADLPALLEGWVPHHLRGFKPGTWLPVQTTVWVKPQV